MCDVLFARIISLSSHMKETPSVRSFFRSATACTVAAATVLGALASTPIAQAATTASSSSASAQAGSATLRNAVGNVAAWGDNNRGQTSIPSSLQGKTVTQIAAGYYHSLALTSDGTITAWGNNSSGQTSIPSSLKGKTVTQIAAGASTSLALSLATKPVALTSPAQGSEVTTRTPHFAGTGEPDATVTVTDANDNELGSGPVDADGNWGFDSTKRLGNGSQTVTAKQVTEDATTTVASTTFQVDAPAFTADVTSVDLHGRSAVLTGTAEPDAYVVINGDDQVQAGESGEWQYTVSGLRLGANTVHLEQFEGTTKTDELDLDVPLEVRDVTATATFDADVSKPVTVSGTAQPGAEIQVKNTDGTVVATATAATDDSGVWDTTVPAPNAGGVYTVHVNQVIDGEKNGDAKVDIDYGAAVTVTSPVENAAHDGGQLTMTGTGKPGSQITVREQGKDTVIGSTTVLVNHNWSLKTSNLDDRRHVLETTQRSSGNNITRDVRTLNPDADATAPLVITAPEYGVETQLDASGELEFRGTGEPEARVTVRAGNGRTIIDTIVDANGTWAQSGIVAVGTSNPFVDYTVNGNTTTIQHRVVAKPFTQAFEVQNPVSGSTVQNPRVTISGIGTPGSTVVLKAGSGREIFSTEVNRLGKWAGIGDFPDNTTSNPTFFVTPVGGATEQHPYRITVGNPGTVKPFTITAPAANSTVTSDDASVTFTGTGTTGATVRFTSGAGSTVATAKVGKDGTWTTKGVVGFRTATLTTEYTLDGNTQTGTLTFTVTKPGVDLPFEVTTPAIGAAVTSPDGRVTFAGTGATGATVKIGSANSDYFSVKVKQDGTWEGSGYVGYRHATSLVTYIDTEGNEHTSNLDYTVVEG